MQISFYCDCGESLSVPRSLRGRKAFCLACRRSIPIPAQIVRAHHMDLAGLPDVNEGTTGVMLPLEGYRIKADHPAAPGGTTLHAPIAANAPGSIPLKERIKAELKSKPALPAAVQIGTPARENSFGAATPPDVRKNNREHTLEVQAPARIEKAAAADGSECWKLTCACGKRILSPLKSPQPYGRCPKCGARLPLPGYDVPAAPDAASAPRVTRVSAVNMPPLPAVRHVGEPLPASESLREDRTTSFAAAAPRNHASNPNLAASVKAADRLRPPRGTIQAEERSASGRISAWPLAGAFRRLLGAFIDLAVAMSAGGAVLAWRISGQDASATDPIFLLITILLLVLWFNDGVVGAIWGGSIGKLLVLAVVHAEDGGPPGVARTLLRALLKWLLIPGWLLGGFDAQQRTLHDLLCGTTVLRARRRAPAGRS